jgi:hypothetical protein
VGIKQGRESGLGSVSDHSRTLWGTEAVVALSTDKTLQDLQSNLKYYIMQRGTWLLHQLCVAGTLDYRSLEDYLGLCSEGHRI